MAFAFIVIFTSKYIEDNLTRTVMPYHTAWGTLEDSLDGSKLDIGMLRAFGAS